MKGVKTMKLFVECLRFKFQEASVYRGNVLLNFFFGLIPLLLSVLLWKTVYTQNAVIGTYDYSQMITYFIFVFLSLQVTSCREVATNLADAIRSGNFHNYLLKPTNYIVFNLKLFTCEKIVYFATVFLPFVLFVLLMKDMIFINGGVLVYFILSLFLAFLMNYVIYFILGMLTVWFEEVTALLDLWTNVAALFSGALFPLSILPLKLEKLVSLLPFKYTLFAPIDIYVGNVSFSKMCQVLFIQGIWLLLLVVLLVSLWRKALKKYSGFGG